MPACPPGLPGSAATSPLTALSLSARSLWAKSGDGTGWLSLPQHMLDSAGVAARLWERWASSALRSSCARACGLSVRDTGVLVSWLAGAHDVGKACRKFQTRLDGRPGYAALTQRIRDAGLDLRATTPETSSSVPHSAASQVILREWLTARGLDQRTSRSLAVVAGCHHGVPSSPTMEKTADMVLGSYDEPWRRLWDELLTFVAEYTGAGPVLGSLRRPVPVTGQMLATGLVIMSDWIASDTERAFPVEVVPDQELRVEQGYAAVGLTAPWEPEPPDLDELNTFLRHRFSWPEDASARPSQQMVAQACQDVDGPALLALEAPTGEGKTEAALLAAEILGSSGAPAGGVLLAAPTMSTSDSLFHRTREWAASASRDSGEVLSMFLGHSRNALNEEYRRLRATQVCDEATDQRKDADYGQVVASQWMSGRKKGLLSTVVVSTVDQVLFMALQARHAMLRHLGLADKVVIIDEVHAYDAYMNVYLARAIEWLARYGTSVVLLSATLPVDVKRSLMEAYARGLRVQQPLGELSSAYPLVTVVSQQGLRELAVPPRPADLEASVSTITDDVPTLVRTVLESTKEGGCVLVLCNTVVRAQEAYTALREKMGEEVRLLHARFVAGDRVSLDKGLVAEMGPRSHRGAGRPARRVVVATQVAEQSLDIDVDLLITDIAPMDLVLQRLGRLHRHARPEGERPEGLRRPRMLLRGLVGAGPQVDAATEVSSPNDLFDSSTVAVYDGALLLATYATLLEGPLDGGVLTRPDDVPHLVQTAYSPAPPIPVAWEEAWRKAVATRRQNRKRSESRANTFLFPSAGEAKWLSNLFPNQDRDVADSARSEALGLAQVRDSDPTIEAVVIIDHPGGYTPLPWLTRSGMTEPLADDQDPGWATAHVLARSTVRLPRSLCLGRTFDTTINALKRTTPTGWAANGLLRGLVALRLDGGLACEVSGRSLRYDRELGLQEMR